jgi:stage II sporulation protein D
VTSVGRHASRLAAACALLLGGLAAAVLAGRTGAQPQASTATGSTTTAPSVTAAPSTTLPASSVVVFSGHGWGHGLGLSQWGAYGYAQHGWTYDRILAHYYTGTTLGKAAVTSLRVLVGQVKKTTLTSPTPVTVVDAAGSKAQLAAGAQLVLKPKLALAGHPELQAPLTFTARLPMSLDGKPYRGKLVVSSDGKLVSVVDVLGLEAYLKGVVAAEMPSAWGPEALKAQAVAARSYALANLRKKEPFDVYGDTRDQVYGGVVAESPAATAAVDATRGQVVLYGGKVADTLFFSTSGGRTASALEATGTAVPYLVPVADPYDTSSPYHDWGPVLFDGAKVAKALKLASPIADVTSTAGASGRVKSFLVTSDDESQVTFNGNQIRSALGLRSTWFTPSLLRLLPAARTMAYGGAVSLTGTARGVDALSLESKATGAAAWTPAGELVPAADGSFATSVKPAVSTQYRLAWGDVRAGLAKISVSTRVDATLTPTGLAGRIRPAVSNAAVQLQQQTGTTWSTVSTTTTDAAGAWSFAGAPAAGSYRVRSAPGHGLVPGVSATVVVQ